MTNGNAEPRRVRRSAPVPIYKPGNNEQPAKTPTTLRRRDVLGLALFPLFLAAFPLFALPSDLGRIEFTYVHDFLDMSKMDQWVSLIQAGFETWGKAFGSVAQPMSPIISAVFALAHRLLGSLLFAWFVVSAKRFTHWLKDRFERR